MDFTSQISTVATFSFTATTDVPWDNEPYIWTLVVGFVVAFILSFAVGANDVANSFGTAVGAKVLTLKQACILATVFETLGAVLIGAKVGETIRKGIIDVQTYDEIENGEVVLILGELSAMFGSAVWQLIATFFKLPVSGTHSIVGACIGFSLVAAGTSGVNWVKLALIVASWFLSPLLSGIMSVFLFFLINYFVLKKDNPLPNGLNLLPVFFAVTVGINIFSILFAGAPLIGLDNLVLWQILLITFSFMVVIALVVYFLVVPRIKRKILKTCKTGDSDYNSRSEKSSDKYFMGPDSGYETPKEKHNHSSHSSIDARSLLQRASLLTGDVNNEKSSKQKLGMNKNRNNLEMNQLKTNVMELGGLENETGGKELIESHSSSIEEDDSDTIRQLFSPLQILTACFASFAHGGNDVSNAIGPLIALWLIFWSGEVVQKAFTPWYLLLFGGIGISIGLWILGRRVIETIGSKLTKVTPSRGFCIELMTAVTVLIASNAGLPVSTTHCKVGSVVSIGWYRSRTAVDWKLAGGIAVAWFVTVPVSGLISAGAMWLLMTVAL